MNPADDGPPPAAVGSLTDVAGLAVGHHTDLRRPTGCTVVLAPAGAVAGVDVRGAAPGTRETDLLAPTNAVERVHAVVLAGGSAFGLDAAGGVMHWLEQRGIGLRVGAATVPIVPAAVLYDLGLGDASVRPDAAAGMAACDDASRGPVAEGNVGAGAGCTIGKLFGLERAMRGGLGSASATIGGHTVAALVAVNAVGDVVDPADGRLVAGARTADGRALLGTMAALRRGEPTAALAIGSATTLGVIATDAVLTKAQATKLAQMAHDGLARTINPVHTLTDGDTVFALATGSGAAPVSSATLNLLGAVGAEVMAHAVLRGVRAATALGLPGGLTLPAAGDIG